MVLTEMIKTEMENCGMTKYITDLSGRTGAIFDITGR